MAQEDLSTPSGSSAGILAVAARIVAETFESLGMKFPEPTVNIKELARKCHHAELEEEKKIEKSKWKQLTTEAKRDKVSKKDGKTAPKGEGAKKSERATQHGKEAQLSEVPERPRSRRRPTIHTKQP
jgi:hypothetical protein